MIALLIFLWRLLLLPSKSEFLLAAENAALRQQLIILQRKVRSRIRFTNSDRLFFRSALSLVPVDPKDDDRHQTGDVGALASGRLSALLAVEVEKPGRPTADLSQAAGPADGCASHIDPDQMRHSIER